MFDITIQPIPMKTTVTFAAIAAVFGLALASAAPVDCTNLTQSVKAAITADQGKILEIVSKEISAAPTCSCEIVKCAIEASSANAETVALIVETAINAAPDQMRLISQCAVAVAPDALANVQALMAKLDPNRGESGTSAKSAKSAKAPAEVAATPNPLDFPGQGPVGPIVGGPGGQPLIPLFPPLIIVNPPVVTSVNPGNDA
jgi:hypothetical protein